MQHFDFSPQLYVGKLCDKLNIIGLSIKSRGLKHVVFFKLLRKFKKQNKETFLFPVNTRVNKHPAFTPLVFPMLKAVCVKW